VTAKMADESPARESHDPEGLHLPTAVTKPRGEWSAVGGPQLLRGRQSPRGLPFERGWKDTCAARQRTRRTDVTVRSPRPGILISGRRCVSAQQAPPAFHHVGSAGLLTWRAVLPLTSKQEKRGASPGCIGRPLTRPGYVPISVAPQRPAVLKPCTAADVSREAQMTPGDRLAPPHDRGADGSGQCLQAVAETKADDAGSVSRHPHTSRARLRT
jgi:hypothetical protein